MRLAAQILSIFGGLLGLFSALGVLAFGESAMVGDAGSRGDARLLGLAALVVALVGIVGGLAISPRPELALPLLLVAAGAGFVPLGGGWLLPGMALATGALLTILSDPDRRPRQATSGARTTRTAPGRWATETLLQPRKHLGLGGGLIYVLIVTLLIFGMVAVMSAAAGLTD